MTIQKTNPFKSSYEAVQLFFNCVTIQNCSVEDDVLCLTLNAGEFSNTLFYQKTIQPASYDSIINDFLIFLESFLPYIPEDSRALLKSHLLFLERADSFQGVIYKIFNVFVFNQLIKNKHSLLTQAMPEFTFNFDSTDEIHHSSLFGSEKFDFSFTVSDTRFESNGVLSLSGENDSFQFISIQFENQSYPFTKNFYETIQSNFLILCKENEFYFPFYLTSSNLFSILQSFIQSELIQLVTNNKKFKLLQLFDPKLNV